MESGVDCIKVPGSRSMYISFNSFCTLIDPTALPKC